MKINKTLRSNVLSRYKENGATWLKSLPSKIKDIASAYNLSSISEYKDLTYNYCASAASPVRDVVIKIGPNLQDLQNEALALKYFSGAGCISLLGEGDGFLLLQKAAIGKNLASFFPSKDEEATQIASKVIQVLQKNHQLKLCPQKSKNVKDILIILNNDNKGVDTKLINLARAKSKELSNVGAKEIFLHGDLHHYNIVQNTQNEWLAIDPKGLVGPPEYECAAFILNPMPTVFDYLKPNTANSIQFLIDKRIEIFANNLKFCKKKILDWCFIQSILSIVWDIEDGLTKNIKKKIEVAEVFLSKITQ